jgi:photosystem II stability/assembly factor-like uncharacterized protein
MKNNFHTTVCCFIFCLIISLSVNAQKFIQKKTGQTLRFTEMQRDFNDWASKNDLKTEKNWKYFKRWEMEMQLHTNAQGEPDNQDTYIYEAVKAAREKEIAERTKSGQTSWYPIGPNNLPDNKTGYMENGLGRINCITFHPNDPSTYFVGVAQGGLWKTTNNGQTWIPLTDNLPITRISDIAIDPNNVNIMYISVCDFAYIGFGLYLNGRKRNSHYGLGVYKTIDGGATWQATGLSFLLTQGDASLIKKIIVNPTNSSALVACGVSGMYTSLNGGANWTKALDSLFWDLIQDPLAPNTLYAASGWEKNSNTGNAAIYKSTNFGTTWTMLNTSIPPTNFVQRIKLAIAPSDNNYVYAVAVDTLNGLYGLYKSTDAGLNWKFSYPGVNVLDGNKGLTKGGQGNYDLGLMIDRKNKDLLYIGGVNIWGSTDGGNIFNPLSHWTLNYGPTLHGDIHFIEQQPLTGNTFVCNDGGVYRTTNMQIGNWTDANNGIPWPTQWTKISDGLAITSFYRISSSKNSSGRIIAGAQDNASFYFDGTNWSTVNGGDGMDNYLDPADDNYIISSSQYGNFASSTDGGLSFGLIIPNVNNEPAEWTSPIIADYKNPGILYAGFANVSLSTDNGYTWSSISNFPPDPNSIMNNEISALAVANSDNKVIYAAKRVRYEYGIPGSVYSTSDGGSNWTNITSNLPDSLYYTGIEVSESTSNEVYISMAGFSAGNKVFKTSDGGLTWQNISYNLPNIPVNCIKNIPGTSTLIIATDIGVYTLLKGSNIWQNISLGLPNVIISDIEFNLALNKLYICTFGRGIWASDLNAIIGIKETEGLASNFKLFPSLNKGVFTISYLNSNVNKEELALDIIDITGKIVSTAKLGKQNTYPVELNLPSGMYFAKIKSKNTSEVKKFIIQ